MFQRDYIMRVIEQLAQALARIAKLERAGERDEARAELTRAVELLTGLPPERVAAMPQALVLQLLETQGEVSLPKGLWLARLLAKHSELCDEATARRCRGQALLLYDALLERASDDELTQFAEHRDTMSWLSEHCC